MDETEQQSQMQPDLDAEGIPDHETPVNADEGRFPPRDRYLGADEHGVTGAEQRRRETPADRRERELPDFGEGDGEPGEDGLDASDPGVRLVQPDAGGMDEEQDEVGSVASDASGPSPEERAVHIAEEG